MVCQPVRLALLIGAITAVAVSPARAGHHHQAPCCNSAPAACCTTPAFRTIVECVPETYQVKRCSYRVECRTETYTAYRCECVPVCKERVCTVMDRVPCMKTVTKRVCSGYNTTYVTKCVTKYNYSYVQECCMQKKCVSRGHWECQCVETCCSKLHRHCDPCACPSYKQKKVWVSCPEYIECPTTVCRKVCTPYTVTCQVPVCTPCYQEVQCQVCSYTCVPRQVVTKYTCYETRQIPCQATRVCRVCVPCEELVTCTRYVTRCRQVPCEAPAQTCCAPAQTCCAPTTCCETSCCQTTCCSQPRHKHCGGGLFGGRHNSSCCR